MALPEHERWQRLSPLLDELLDLSGDARSLRLEALRAQAPELVAELASLIDAAARADAAQFLAGGADAGGGARAGAADPMSALQGQRIGAYVFEVPLGQGGTGTVWRARRADGRFEGAVAIKLLHLSLLGRAGARRFEREGAILARLSHPNIARLLDAGVTPSGQPYLVLELVQGLRIDRHCDERCLSVEQRLTLFTDVLAAVAHAHSHGVIHRDIKPTNILVTPDGAVKLLDFGIAKLLQDEEQRAGALPITRDGNQAMTPEYAAPEQLRGDDVTTATDVYALGVLLYQLLAGAHPTAPPRGTPADVIRATLETDPGRLSSAVTGATRAGTDAPRRVAADRATSPQRLQRRLSGDLEHIVARALHKVPAQRYGTVAALGEDLRRHLAHEPVSACADSFTYRTGRFVARHRGAVAAGVLTFTAIVAGLVGTISQARRAEQQGQRANQEAQRARSERDGALEQQRLLRGNNEFLQLLMRDAAGGDPGAIRRQLDRASVLLDKTRFEAPIVKVALMRQTAARYAELGDMAQAVAMIRQAIASTDGTELAQASSAVPVNLACSLARYLFELDELGPAQAELDRADRLMAGGAALSVPSRVECRMERSFIESALGRFDAGIAIAREALRTLEAAGVRAGEQHRIVRSALSRALWLDGRNAEALAIAAPLLSESESAQGRESMAVVRRSSFVTSLIRAGGQPLSALALSEADEASVSHLLGADAHDAAIDLEHGRVLLALGRYGEASQVLQRAAAVARDKRDLRPLLPAELAAAEALVRAGHAAQAAEVFALAEPERATVLREGRPEQIEVHRVEALLASARGDAATSARALALARSEVDAAGGDTHPTACAVALDRAEAALAAGRTDAALAEDERALAAARRSALDAARSSDIGRALALRARIRLATGMRAQALTDARVALANLESALGPAHPETRAALRVLAAAR